MCWNRDDVQFFWKSIYLSIYLSFTVCFKNALSLIGFIAGGVGQLMLDISMRPGSAETFPLLASFGIVVYILEGVGIFQSTRFAEDPTSFYQNEGHGLYIPTRSMDEEGSSTDDFLHVRTHELSHLRFLLLGAPVSS